MQSTRCTLSKRSSRLGRICTAFSEGLTEVQEGFRRFPVWWALAQEATLDQHRQTTLGPLWLVLNYLLYVGTFVVVFADRSGIDYFGQYAATGMFVWLLLAEAMRAGVTLFNTERSYIQGTTLPLFVYVMRLSTQLVIRTAYSAIGWLGILIATGFPSLWGFALALIGLVVVALLLPAGIVLMAFLGVFFPDMKFIVQNLVRVGIFLTPVFWVASEAHGLRKLLYMYDPFTYVLAVVREPILYGSLSYTTVWVCATLLIATWVAAILVLGFFRKRVVFAL